MEESTPKKGIPVALVAGIAAVALLAVAVGGWFGLCAWVRDNGQLLPGAGDAAATGIFAAGVAMGGK